MIIESRLTDHELNDYVKDLIEGEKSRLVQIPFDQENRRVNEIFAGKLPQPSKKLCVVTVVPALNELRNNNFWLFLYTLSHQFVNPSHDYEVLYVVNNTEELLHKQSEEYIDNQSLLKILRVLRVAIDMVRNDQTSFERIDEFVNLQLLGMDLTPWQKKIILFAIRRRVPIIGVDLSSSGFTVDTIFDHTEFDNKIGTAFNIGSHLAYSRLSMSETPTNRQYIDFLGADCMLPRDYYKEMIQRLKEANYPKFVSKSIRTSIYEIGYRITEEIDPCKKLARLIDQFRQTISFHYSYLHTPKAKAGVSQCLSVDTLRQCGGYPYIYRFDPDYALYKKVVTTTGVDSFGLSEPHVELNHRSRNGSFDGRYVGLLAGYTNISGIDTLVKILDKKPETAELLFWLERDEIIMNNTHLRNEYIKLKRKYYREEVRLKMIFINLSKRLIKALVENKRKPNENRSAYLNRLLLLGLISSDLHTFVLSNQAIIDLVENLFSILDNFELGDVIMTESDDFSTVWDFLVRYVPEYFALPATQELDFGLVRKAIADNEPINLGDFMYLPRALYSFLPELKGGEYWR